MKNYTLKKFLADLAILGLVPISVASFVYLGVIFALLNAITHR